MLRCCYVIIVPGVNSWACLCLFWRPFLFLAPFVQHTFTILYLCPKRLARQKSYLYVVCVHVCWGEREKVELGLSFDCC